jgi:hypothetical protein
MAQLMRRGGTTRRGRVGREGEREEKASIRMWVAGGLSRC